MAKQIQRTARKDYPEQSIKKGDLYWFAKIKTGPRSSRTIRSLTRIPEKDLTSSEYRRSILGLLEQRDCAKCLEDVETILSEVEQLRDEQQEKLDNMPEGLQQGDTGQLIQSRLDALEEAVSQLQEIVNSWPDEEDFESDDDGSREEKFEQAVAEKLEEAQQVEFEE